MNNISKDFIVRNAHIENNSDHSSKFVDIEIRDGVIDRICEAGKGDIEDFDQDLRFDANKRLVTPPLTEPHCHLDATLTAGEPRWNDSGTLAEGIKIWGERKEDITKEGVKNRAKKTIEWYASNGTTRIRTHADSTEESLIGIESLIELKEEIKDIVDLQVVAFPQDGIFTRKINEDLHREAMEMGADVVGGIPHNEHTREDGVADVNFALELAEKYDKLVDIHIDETDDPNSRFTEVLASEAIKREIGEIVTGSHATAMHSYNNSYADKLISIIKESNISIITNPPDNSVLQGSYDDYPRRRGHTRIDQLLEANINVGMGHDSVMDPWYHYGKADMLDAAYILVHYAHMSGYSDVSTLWKMITHNNASIFKANDYGLKEGNEGSLVVYNSNDLFNALRTNASRILVLKDGKPIARTEPKDTKILRNSGTRNIDFHR